MTLAILFLLVGLVRFQNKVLASDTSEEFNVSFGNERIAEITVSRASLCEDKELQCPPWSYCREEDGTCHCLENGNDIFKCDSNTNRSYILSCYCATHDVNLNITEVGVCLYNCDFMGKARYDIDVDYGLVTNNVSELNDAMCGSYQRTGTLCGKCINGTYLRAYSYDMSCIKCEGIIYNLMKYILVAYVPLTLLCFLVMVFRLNIPSSQIQGFVLFSQILSSPIFTRATSIYVRVGNGGIVKNFWQIFGSLYGIWNLDFFRLYNLEICFKVSPLTTLALDFFVALYPLVLIVFIYILTIAYDNNFRAVVLLLKPFKSLFSLFKKNWDIKTSSVDAFATFMFLSNVKFLCVCFDLLAPVQVCNSSQDSSCRWALFYDATVPYFSQQHIPYAITAILILLIFVLLPIIIGTTYSLKKSQNCFNLIPHRWQIGLHIFVDSFQGCYKDGTESGTRDCRWFSVMTFAVRFIIFSVYSAVILETFLPLCVMIITLTACAIIIVDPFKSQFQHFSKHLVVFVLFLACTITCAMGLDYNSSVMAELYIVSIAIGTIHIVYSSVLVIKWIVGHRTFSFKNCCSK